MKLKTYIIVCSIVFVLQAFITSLLPVFRGVDPLLCLMLAVVFISGRGFAEANSGYSFLCTS